MRRAARALAVTFVEQFNEKMKAQFPDFTMDWSDKPTDYIEDGLESLAYRFVSECERDRQDPRNLITADKRDDFEFEGYR